MKENLIKIVNIIFEEIEKLGENFKILNKYSNPRPNAYHGQMEQGYILKWSYSSPNTILTELGIYHFFGSTSISGDKNYKEILIKRLSKRLGLELYREEENNIFGTFGPYYKITKIDEVNLPNPIERKRKNYIEYKKLQEQINKLF
jgi:hypothetical protein